MISLIEELFKKNKERIDNNKTSIDRLRESGEVSSFTYSFVQSTLTEANAFTPVDLQVRFITNARKSGEGVGAGTGLPAFWDYQAVTPQWVDFMGNPIQV